MVVVVGFLVSTYSPYIIHGLLGDTDNQFAVPHKLGKGTIPRGLVYGFMVVMSIGVIGGFAVLFTGAMLADVLITLD